MKTTKTLELPTSKNSTESWRHKITNEKLQIFKIQPKGITQEFNFVKVMRDEISKVVQTQAVSERMIENYSLEKLKFSVSYLENRK